MAEITDPLAKAILEARGLKNNAGRLLYALEKLMAERDEAPVPTPTPAPTGWVTGIEPIANNFDPAQWLEPADTSHNHVCGAFRDEFDWSTLDADYLERIGARLSVGE